MFAFTIYFKLKNIYFAISFLLSGKTNTTNNFYFACISNYIKCIMLKGNAWRECVLQNTNVRG